jgi:hypothetical protein
VDRGETRSSGLLGRRILARVAKEAVDQVQEFLWIMAMDDMIGPGEVAFGRRHRDDRQLWNGLLHELGNALRAKAGDAAVQD